MCKDLCLLIIFLNFEHKVLHMFDGILEWNVDGTVLYIFLSLNVMVLW